MRRLFKQSRVIHNPTQRVFIVQYRNHVFCKWYTDKEFGYINNVTDPEHFGSMEFAMSNAIKHANTLITMIEVYRSGFLGFGND